MTVESERTSDGVRLTLHGELDIVGADELRAQGRSAIVGAERVTLDLSGLDLLDSTGLAALLELHRQAERDGTTRFETVSPHGSEARLVIELSGVGPMLGLREP